MYAYTALFSNHIIAADAKVFAVIMKICKVIQIRCLNLDDMTAGSVRDTFFQQKSYKYAHFNPCYIVQCTAVWCNNTNILHNPIYVNSCINKI